LTLREYLWANVTTAVVPAVTPKPERTGKATQPAASPAFSAEPLASPDASGVPPSEESSPPQLPGSKTSATESPAPSPPAIDASPVADLDPAIAVGLVAALLTVLAVTVMVLRRGRSGVGL
jgi:hypothetical protein